MIKNKKQEIVIMDFSGIYRQENFCVDEEVSWVEVQDLTETNCYCDDEAKEEIQKRICNFSSEGIHYIDSGNYHYMSRIWLEKIKEPFRLLVFDNHTDMQLPAFGGILSCGGWIAASLKELANLQEVILVGPDEVAFSQVEPELKEKVQFLSKEKLYAQTVEENVKFFETLATDLPLYISVDKDVLCKEDASTTWSQGNVKLEEMERYLVIVREIFDRNDQCIIGMDVCGECDMDSIVGNELNDAANMCLLNLWKKWNEIR